MDWAFADGGFEIVEGEALVDNQRSWRSLERLGLTFQRLRPNTFNGRTITWRIYVMKKTQVAGVPVGDDIQRRCAAKMRPAQPGNQVGSIADKLLSRAST